MIKLFWIFFIIQIFLALLFIFFNSFNNSFITNNIDTSINKSSSYYYDNLFSLINYDYYNISLIYNYPYNTIKIKHIGNKKIFSNSIVCVFGILVNDNGLEIANSMLQWLSPEYDIYCVYQKYPGKLFEYPALRFAQWISIVYNIEIILYIHTKGAFYQYDNQIEVRKIWKLEFTKPRNHIYIQLIQKNLTDLALPFRAGICTWYNGMFISNRAFKLIETIGYDKSDRYFYESLFRRSNKTLVDIRFKGVLNDCITPDDLGFEQNKYLTNYKIIKNKRKTRSIRIIIIYFSLYILILLIKLLFFYKK